MLLHACFTALLHYLMNWNKKHYGKSEASEAKLLQKHCVKAEKKRI